tara:strand:- start:149 stop:355 length:207 start_codon:yes stop_codon:yes gene_type:complete
MVMSGEQLADNQLENLETNKRKRIKNKVDINILLNKVRSEEKKEKFESLVFISLISFVVILTGIIVSL